MENPLRDSFGDCIRSSAPVFMWAKSDLVTRFEFLLPHVSFSHPAFASPVLARFDFRFVDWLAPLQVRHRFRLSRSRASPRSRSSFVSAGPCRRVSYTRSRFPFRSPNFRSRSWIWGQRGLLLFLSWSHPRGLQFPRSGSRFTPQFQLQLADLDFPLFFPLALGLRSS